MSAPRPVESDFRPLVGGAIMLVGGVLALLISGVGLVVIPLCLSVANAGCFGLPILIALPAITGIVSLTFGVLVLVRPRRHRFYGGIVFGVSTATIVSGVAYLARYPAALLFVLVLYAWPVLVILIGSVIAVLRSPITS